MKSYPCVKSSESKLNKHDNLPNVRKSFKNPRNKKFHEQYLERRGIRNELQQ